MGDKNKTNSEIFGASTESIKKKFEEDGHNWEKVKEQLKNIEKKEKIDKNITKVKGNVDKKYKKLKQLLEKNTNNLKDKAEKKLESVAQKTLGKIEKEIEKSKGPIAGAIFGGVGGFLINMFKGKKEKPTTFMGKIGSFLKKLLLPLGLGILGAIAGKKIWEKYGTNIKNFIGLSENKEEDKKDSKSENNISNNASPTIGINHIKQKVKNINGKTNNPENNEIVTKKEKAYKIIGYTIIRNFSGIHFEEQNSSNNIYGSIGKIKYKILESYFTDASRIYKENGKNNNAKENAGRYLKDKISGLKNIKNTKDIFDTFESIFSPGLKIIYKQRLRAESIKSKLFDDNNNPTHLAKSIFEENELIQLKQSGLIDLSTTFYQNLGPNIIAKLLTVSFSNLIIAGSIKGLNTIKDGFIDMIKGAKNLIEDIKKDNKNILSYESINILQIGIPNTQENVFRNNIEEFNGYENLPNTEKSKIINFIDFKNKLFNAIQNNNNINLGINIFDSFKTGVNLSKVYFLYLALDGKAEFNLNGNSIKKLTLYSWISKIISNKNINDNKVGKYLEKLASKQKDKNDNIFNEDDKIIIGILLERAGRTINDNINEKFSAIEGAVTGFIEEKLEDLGVPKEWGNSFARALEVGIAGALLFLTKNWYFRIFIATAIVPVVYILIQKGVYNKLHSSVQKELDKMIDSYAKEGKYIDVNGKQIKITSAEELKKYARNNEKAIEEYEKKQYYELSQNSIKNIEKNSIQENKVNIEISKKDGLTIYYKKHKYKIENHLGSDIDINKIKIETNNFIFGNNENNIKISFESIYKAFDKNSNPIWIDGEYTLVKKKAKTPTIVKNIVSSEKANKYIEDTLNKLSDANIIIKRID